MPATCIGKRISQGAGSRHQMNDKEKPRHGHQRISNPRADPDRRRAYLHGRAAGSGFRARRHRRLPRPRLELGRIDHDDDSHHHAPVRHRPRALQLPGPAGGACTAVRPQRLPRSDLAAYRLLQRVASRPVSAAQAVNEQSFTDLLVPLVQPAYRLACALLHDAPAAEDVVQEASLIAWRKLGRLQDRSRLKGWFLGIVANECRNARRRRRLTRVSVGLARGLAGLAGEERVAGRAALRHALRRLAYEDRLVVVLYFYLDMPLSEIAVVAGTSEAAARTRLYRAIRRLRPDVAIQEALQ